MNSTTTLRSDTARTGTNPNFPITTKPWRKYVSIDLGDAVVPDRPVRAGVLVVQDWLITTGPHQNETHTLVLVATTTNELFCFSEGDLLQNGSGAKPLWYTSIASNGFPPSNRTDSNMRPPIGISGTPVVDAPNRRMFVVALWQSGTGNRLGNYSIFSISIDTGAILTSQHLADSVANDRLTFNADAADAVDQRTAINLVGGWLWLGFAAIRIDDGGNYSGWVVAINPDKLEQQLYQPIISEKSWDMSFKLRGGGVWGVGGLGAAVDGTVYALTGNAGNNLKPPPDSYWPTPPNGPGNIQDYFQAAVHLRVEGSGSASHLAVQDWFQDSTLTKPENNNDWDFGGSSPVILPPINGRQLLAFIPKDGNIFILDAQKLGNYTSALTIEKIADAKVNNGPDTMTAMAFVQTPDRRGILIGGAVSNLNNNALGGVAAFQIDASVNPPTLTKLWKSTGRLYDSFGAPIVIANPVTDPSKPPNPVGLAWVIYSTQMDSFRGDCTMRAYDVLTGSVVYDSNTAHEVAELIPSFAPLTSGGSSVFCPTSKGFMGFTQFTGWSGTQGWESIGGFFPAGCPITAISRKPGQLDLFVVGIDGYVYTSWWSEGNNWSGTNGWRQIGGIFQAGARITAVSRTPDTLDIFVCGEDGRVYTSWYPSQNDWWGAHHPWLSLGGFFPPGNQVTAVSRTSNSIDLFIVGGDGVVYNSEWSGTSGWTGIGNNWRNLGGTFPPSTRVAAVTRTPDNLDLFICGDNGFVYTSQWSSNSGWSGLGNNWTNIGGIFPAGAKVTAVARKADHLDLFITGINSIVYTSSWSPNAGWSGLKGWESIGGIFNPGAEVAAVHRSATSLDLFICGENGFVYTSWWSEGNNWSSTTNKTWLNIGGIFPANVHVDAVSRTTGDMDLFICGIDGRVYTSWWNVSGH